METLIKTTAFLLLISAFAPFSAGAQTDTYPPNQEEKKMVIDQVASWLREYYVFPDVAEKCIQKMNDQFDAGAYDIEMELHVEFVRLLNADLLEVSNDKHLKVVALFGVEEDEVGAALLASG